MNTAVAVEPSNTVPPLVSSVQEIPLRNISRIEDQSPSAVRRSKTRRTAGNIRQHGVLQPVLVRPLPDENRASLNSCGGARYRASKLAGRETNFPSVRALTDTQCLELQLIEKPPPRRRARTRRSAGAMPPSCSCSLRATEIEALFRFE